MKNKIRMMDDNKTLMMILMAVLLVLLFGSFGVGMMGYGKGMMGGYYGVGLLSMIIILIIGVGFVMIINKIKEGNKK